MRIVLFANSDWYLYNFRRALALALRAQGHEVILLSAEGEWGLRLREMGLDWRSVPLSRRGMNPFEEALAVWRLRNLYRHLQPDLVHHFTIKSVIYGSLAARLARVKRVVNAITGQGFLMVSPSLQARLLRALVLPLYRYALAHSVVIFQNEDDRQTFSRRGLLKRARNVALIPGSGVNTARFHPAVHKPDLPMIVMAARLLWPKGVGVFVEAARQVKARMPAVRFAVAGCIDEGNPESVDAATLQQWRAEGLVEFVGHCEDMSAFFAAATMAVLPSYYGEGVPRSLIEAAACGLPLITTDMPGCRDIVVHGQNGLLVRPKDSQALAEAMLALLQDPDRMSRLGEAGLRMVQQVFAEDRILRMTIESYPESPNEQA